LGERRKTKPRDGETTNCSPFLSPLPLLSLLASLTSETLATSLSLSLSHSSIQCGNMNKKSQK